jgi:DNA-binding NarL/FixJ family response regulator
MKILVVDDHLLVREGLRHVLQALDEEGVEVLGAASAHAAFELADEHPEIDLMLLDLNMPDMHGIAALDEFGRRHPDIPVVMLSGNEDHASMRIAFDHGAAGFITKSTLSDQLVAALRVIFAGGIYVPPQLFEAAERLTRPKSATEPAHEGRLGLTERQQEVLQMVLKGKTNKEICRLLDLAEPTVKAHVGVILRVLGVQSRTQAVIAAGRLGLTQPVTLEGQ